MKIIMNKRYYLYEYSTTKFIFEIIERDKSGVIGQVIFDLGLLSNFSNETKVRLEFGVHDYYKEITIPEYLALKMLA
jgi:hypothetical protein